MEDASLVLHCEDGKTTAFEWRGPRWACIRIPFSYLHIRGGVENIFPFPCRLVSVDVRTHTARFARADGIYRFSWLFWRLGPRVRELRDRAALVRYALTARRI
jgi:hypothetical protein